MNRFTQFALIALAAVALPVSGQVRPRPAHPPGPGGNVPPHLIMERLNRMSPEEREQMLHSLPPDKRQKLEERLQHFRDMPPMARERLRREYNEFQQLPAEKQEQVRQMFRKFSEVPEDRRLELRRELNRLRNMPQERRDARIKSERYKSDFTEDERQLLEGLVAVLPPPPPPPARQSGPAARDAAQPVN